jgi:hypothetical protein
MGLLHLFTAAAHLPFCFCCCCCCENEAAQKFEHDDDDDDDMRIRRQFRKNQLGSAWSLKFMILTRSALKCKLVNSEEKCKWSQQLLMIFTRPQRAVFFVLLPLLLRVGVREENSNYEAQDNRVIEVKSEESLVPL